MRQVIRVFVGLSLFLSTNLSAMLPHVQLDEDQQSSQLSGSGSVHLTRADPEKGQTLAASSGAFSTQVFRERSREEGDEDSSTASIGPMGQSSRAHTPALVCPSEQLEDLTYILAIQTLKNALFDIVESVRKTPPARGNVLGPQEFQDRLSFLRGFLVSVCLNRNRIIDFFHEISVPQFF